MANLASVLTENQRAALDRSVTELEDALQLLKAAQACEMDCADWMSVRDTLARKIALVRANFYPKS